jgi:hypothetical protein
MKSELPFTFHITTKTRLRGESASGAFAYVGRTTAIDPWSGKKTDHRKKHADVIFWFMVTPDGVVEEPDPRTHFRTLDHLERKKNSRVVREVIGSLPHVLSGSHRIHLCLDFALWFAREYEVVVYVALHRAPPKGDPRNKHFHMLVSTRNLSGQKLRTLDNFLTSQWLVPLMRTKFADITNQRLVMAGCEQRVDARSYETRGIDKTAQQHLGQRLTRILRESGRVGYNTFENPNSYAKTDLALSKLAAEAFPKSLMVDLETKEPTEEEAEHLWFAAETFSRMSKTDTARRDFAAFVCRCLAKQPTSELAVLADEFDFIRLEGAEAFPVESPSVSMPNQKTEPQVEASVGATINQTGTTPLPVENSPAETVKATAPALLMATVSSDTESSISVAKLPPTISQKTPPASAPPETDRPGPNVVAVTPPPANGVAPRMPSHRSRSGVSPKPSATTSIQTKPTDLRPILLLADLLRFIREGRINEADARSIEEAHERIETGKDRVDRLYSDTLRRARRLINHPEQTQPPTTEPEPSM